MKRKTVYVTLIFFVSTVVQVVSNIVLTRIFGSNIVYSHFLAAVTIPTIIITVIYGTLNDALQPIYGEKLVKDSKNSEDFFLTQLNSLTILSIFLTIMLNFLSPWLMNLLFGESKSLFVPLLVRMFTVLNLAIPFAVFVTVLGMWYYAHKNFLRFPIAQLFGSIANLLIVIFFYQKLNIWSLIYAFVISIIIQIFFVLPKHYRPKIGNIMPVFYLWLPLVIGITALKSDSLIIRTFSAQLPNGYIVYHNLISKVCSLSAGLVTIGIQVLFLPNIIEKLAQNKITETKKMVNKVKIVAISLSLLLIAAIYFVAPFFIKLLFVGGKFTVNDYDLAISLLPYYLLPVLGWGIDSVFLQPLYALKKHLHVGILGLFCFGVAWVAALAVSKTSPNLAISTALSILLLGTTIGSEIIWQIEIKKK